MEKKVLVVDSDYFFVEFLSELLTNRGYEVLKAYNGKEGIALLENDSVDIIFADLILPKVDGPQFFKFIRHKYNGNPIPIIALSGTMIEQLGSLHEIGADYFIAKGPIDLLTIKLNEFMAEIETQPFSPPVDKKVLATGNVYPRRDAMEISERPREGGAARKRVTVGALERLVHRLQDFGVGATRIFVRRQLDRVFTILTRLVYIDIPDTLFNELFDVHSLRSLHLQLAQASAARCYQVDEQSPMEVYEPRRGRN